MRNPNPQCGLRPKSQTGVCTNSKKREEDTKPTVEQGEENIESEGFYYTLGSDTYTSPSCL